jgi:lysophospholipase L1-like esterase
MGYSQFAQFKPFTAGSLNTSTPSYNLTDQLSIDRYLLLLTAGMSTGTPIATAGSSLTIQQPTSTATLMGAGSEAGGTIASYAWRQVTGPVLAGFPATTQNVSVMGMTTAGTYQFGLIVTDAAGVKSAESFTTITVNAAAPIATDYTVTPVATDWVSNVISGAAYSATGQLSPLSYIYVSTDATSISTNQHTQLPDAGTLSAIGILSGTALVESLSTDFTGAVQQVKSNLPGTGQRLLKFVTGPSREIGSTHNVAETNIDSLVFHGGTNAAIVAQPTPPSRIVIGGDSISSGFIATHPTSEGTARQLENLLGYQVAVYAWGGRSFGRDQFTSAQQDAVVASIAAWLNAPGVSLKEYWGELGINDVFGFGTQTAAALRPAIASFYAKLQAAVPGIRIWAQGNTYHTQLYTSYNIDTAANYSAAFIGAASDTANVVYVDGLGLTTNDSTVLAADGVHLNTLGQTQAAQAMYNIINGVSQPFVLGTKFLRIDGSDAFAYTEFTAALNFTANASVGTSNGQLVVHGYNGPNTVYTVGSFAIYVNGGSIAAFLQDGTTNATPGANVLTIPCPSSGPVMVIYSGGPNGQQLRVGNTVLNAAGRSLASPSGIKMSIGATPTAPTGSATQGNNLNCPITNFSFFKRVLSTAEKDSLVAGNGILSQTLATDASLLSYSRLIPQSPSSTALLDNVSNTLRIQVLIVNSSTPPPAPGAANFTLLTGMSFSGNVLTRTAANTNNPDAFAVANMSIIKGSTTGEQGRINWGTTGGTAGRFINGPVFDKAVAAGATTSPPAFYLDTANAYYNVLKQPAGFLFSPNVTPGSKYETVIYVDHLDYVVDGAVKYTDSTAPVFPYVPKVFMYTQGASLTGVTLTGYLAATV